MVYAEYLSAQAPLVRLFEAIENENIEEIRTLISQLGGYVNVTRLEDDEEDGDDGYTPLHEAVLTGNIEILKIFTEAENVDMNVKDFHGFTALHLAAQTGSAEVIKLLLNTSRLDVNARDNKGHTALYLTLDSRNFEAAKIFIDAAVGNVNSENFYWGKNALLFALDNNEPSFADYLLSRGADVNYRKEDYNQSLLHIAADKNEGDSHLDMMEVLLKNGADVNAQDINQNTPLHILINKRTKVEPVKLLLDYKADVNLKNSLDQIPLIKAISKGNTDVAQLLLDQCGDVKSCDSDGYTILHHVVSENEEDSLFAMLEVLLKKGADVNAQSNYCSTPFHNLVYGGGVKTVKLFLRYGADVHVKNNDGETPLFAAVSRKDVEFAQLLVDLGADVSVVNNEGETPLFNAVKCKNVEVPQLLINQGASVNIVSSLGENALFNAVRDNNVEVVKLLIEHGVNVNTVNNQGKNALFYVAKSGNFEIVKLLINQGTKVDVVSIEGENSLFNAAKSENVEVVKLLIEKGAEVDIINKQGQNALFNAVRSENVEIVELLLDHGSRVNIVCKDEFTPLHLAAWNFRDSCKILKCLLKHGADADALESEGQTALLILFKESSYLDSFEKASKLMLKHSNVDIIDPEGNSFLSYDDISETAQKIGVEHIAILKALEVSVHLSIMDFISSDAGYSDYFAKCTAELTVAKTTKVKNCWVTFFNLLVDDGKKLKNYAGNAGLVEDFKKSDYLNKFPIYGPSMEKNMSKGIKRRKLFDKSSGILSNYWPIFSPTHLIIRELFDCLATKELSKFCE